MFTYEEFLKRIKLVAILTACILLHTIKATDYELYLKHIKKDFQLMRWFSKSMENFNLDEQRAHNLIQNYGYKKGELIPSLRTTNVPYHLPPDARKYHLVILEQATSVKNPIVHLAILQIKYLAFFNAINYTNCALYIKHYDLPGIKYCKELALALLDFSLMGTDILCINVFILLGQETIKQMLKNFSNTLKYFESTYRSQLESIRRTEKNSFNNAEYLLSHAEQTVSGYFNDELCGNENIKLLPAMRELSNFLKSKKFEEPLPPIKRITHEPLFKAMKWWLKAESVYNDSQSSGQLDFMEILFNSEMLTMGGSNYIDDHALYDFETIHTQNYQLNTMEHKKIDLYYTEVADQIVFYEGIDPH